MTFSTPDPVVTNRIDVLVVGAGPIGLMAAGDLARRGVTVRIVERTTERSPLSKALVVHARTLEIMDVAGLAEQFVTRGYPAPGLNVGLGSIAKPISINMNVLDTRFPYMLVLPQAETEEILAGRLADQDVKVERGTELVGVEQDGSEVTATLRVNGEDERVRARYLIGSDGAHSTVRSAVDLPFAGEQLEQLVLLGDVKADTEFVRSRITNLTSPRGFVSILPFLGDYVRVFAVDFAKQDRTRSDELSLEDLQDTVNSISPTPIELSEPRWLTRFSAPSRQVRTTRVGNVFLAGDAAHAHSPAAGQGMNTGLQDVANLSWKLAMVLRGQAPAALLDSYDEERHPVHTRVRHATDRMFRSFVLRNPVAKLGRDVVARSLIPRSPVQRKLAENLSGIAVNYRDTSRTQAERGTKLPHGAVQPGDRIPDVELWQPHRTGVRLYELLREPGYALFLFVGASRLRQERERLALMLKRIGDTYGAAVRPHVVLDEGVPEPFPGAEVLVDHRGQFRSGLGIEHGGVLLARPDSYLAVRHAGFEPDAVMAALAPWVQPSAVTA